MREWREIPGGLICVKTFDARTEQIVAHYRDGETLDQVGKRFGITRERVRQIIARYARYRGPVEGGASVVGARKQAAYEAERDRRYVARLGLTFAQYRVHIAEHGASTRPGSPLNRFANQRHSAQHRGIDWQMSFADWWRIWCESGRWGQRGRGTGYCMARYRDAGPYSPENVYICTCAENSRDSYIVDHPRRKRSERVTASWAVA